MHQNKIPRPAENRIIRIGDGAVFLIFLQIRCVAPSMANTAIERKSGANPACKSVRPNSVDSAMLSAVARIIATTHGRTPDKKALTGAYFIRFFSADSPNAKIVISPDSTVSGVIDTSVFPECLMPRMLIDNICTFCAKALFLELCVYYKTLAGKLHPRTC